MMVVRCPVLWFRLFIVCLGVGISGDDSCFGHNNLVYLTTE